MKIIIYLLLIISPFNLFGINTDSLLAEKISIERPYIVLNITSGECITCRSAAVYILNKIKSNIDKSKIVLLSDDKNMAIYFNDNKDIFGDYIKVYDKNLSIALAKGRPSATVCLIKSDSIISFVLTKVNRDTINYINNSINNNNNNFSKKEFVFKDSIFKYATRFYTYQDISFIFNVQFQIGLICNKKFDTQSYLRVKIDNLTGNRLIDILKKNRHENFQTAEYANSMLKKRGIANATLYSVDLQSRSAYFKIYAVARKTSNDFKDTTIYFLPFVFLAKGLSDGKEICNLNDYESFTFLNSIISGNDTLYPMIEKNYEFSNNHVFVPYCNVRSIKNININGKNSNVITDIRIAELNFKNDNASDAINIFHINEGEDGPGTFFFRVSNSGVPIVVSKTHMSIDFINQNRKILFNDLLFGIGDTVNNVFDISVTDNVLRFVASTNKNNFVKGIYNLLTKKMQMEKLENGNFVYGNIRISGNTILAFNKNEDSNVLILDQFMF